MDPSEDAPAAPLRAPARPGRPPVQLERARTWLAGYLTAHGGHAASADVKAAALRDGVTPGCLLRAAGTLVRIESVAGAGHRTVWTLADPDAAPGCRTAIGAARQWLAAHLTASAGRARRREVLAAGAHAGHRAKTLERARTELGVVTRTIPGTCPRRTEWLLPATADADAHLPPDLAAEVWLVDYLAERGGEADSARLRSRATAAGHHARTLGRARLRAGVGSRVVPGSFPRRTTWTLPLT